MKKMRKIRALLAAFTLTLPSWHVQAGEIAIETGEGNVAALLERDAHDFTDAVGRALIDLTDSPPSGKTFAWLRSKVQGATLARIEYAFEKNGQRVMRVYHGRSGHSLETIIEKATRRSASHASGTESSATESGDGIDIPEADDIARDAAEAKYYRRETEFDVRAPKLPEDTSRLEATVVDNMNHSWDAELKTLRRIESDIQNKVVPAGGRLTGYVSKTVCESCREVIDTFARVFNAEGTIYQLIEPGTGAVTGGGATAIQRSRAASNDLLAARKAYAKANLNPARYVAMREEGASTLADVSRLEEESVVLRDIDGDPCAP
ncbi:hypothetical protein QFZ41_001612 [Luteibacter sp. W1I16]|uniref:hypothetical protein n=1 Tax=Luteibacter sp. W1I16 TaxID=3373922 RepID=UPI003D2412C5